MAAGSGATPEVARAIQDHVKVEIAPYKYPREIAFVAALPHKESRKLQWFRLRQRGRAATQMLGRTLGGNGTRSV